MAIEDPIRTQPCCSTADAPCWLTHPTNSLAEDRGEWAGYLDSAITEIFERMVLLPLTRTARRPPAAMQNNISAAIVFSGTLLGRCLVRVSPAIADKLTDVLLGAEGDWDDEMIDDTVGELCNMIAGGWKSRLGPHASMCDLSIPIVSRRPGPELVPYGSTVTHRLYAFAGSVLEVTLTLS